MGIDKPLIHKGLWGFSALARPLHLPTDGIDEQPAMASVTSRDSIHRRCEAMNPDLISALGQWVAFCNRQVRKFTFVDVKLIQFCGILMGIILAKFVPSLLQLSIWWLLAMALIFAVRPVYVFLAGTDSRSMDAADVS
jgi:hypothetical protein